MNAMNPGMLALLIPIVAIGGLFLLLIIGSVAREMRRASQARAQEESRREIAAYVAEGSITPQDAERLLAAEPKARRDA
jgi:hypothetical protein